MTAEGLNARWEILIDLFFEVDPDKLREKLVKLKEYNRSCDYILDKET